jgi:4-amino-4-deoxy-L-arabinose transferase-like glycosyltransferase
VKAAWLCAFVACLSAACWSLITPAFQAPDEQDHYAYVALLAQTGRPPSSSDEVDEPEELAALIGLRYLQLRHQPRNHAIASTAEQETLESNLASVGERHYPGGIAAAGVASSEPPLYYALETIPYRLAGSVLGRLPLMRLLSALMAAVTALFAYLFVRETLPGVEWAWIVGGLGVALVPLLGFMSGAVNPDSMLFAVSAVLFYTLARAFRRGLTTRLAFAIGAVIAVGMATKLNFIGLLPGALAGLIMLSARATRTSGHRLHRLAGLACAVAGVPAALYAILYALSGDPPLGSASGALAGVHLSLGELGYMWQLYLPRLPGTVNDFPGLFTTRQLWFDGYVGLYGWFDTTFPGWVYDAALVPAGLIAALCIREFVAARAALRDRLAELATYALMAVGLMALIGLASYADFPTRSAEFAETRYLLPLLPLLGAVLALAARAGGERWGRAFGALIVVLFFAHDLFSQLLVVSRFYG